ncbi:MAG: cadherin-like beta sandwich domain-containing protein [Clostridia bacterium]|nr:cadherin-like beta sandwich domain-containing protein [Clostridia bacterium]
MKKMFFAPIACIVSICLATAFPSTVYAQGGISVSLKGPSSVSASESFDVNVVLSDLSSIGGNGIYSADFTVSFDSGSFELSGNPSLVSNNNWDSTKWSIKPSIGTGTVEIKCYDKTVNNDYPIISDGTLCKLHFRVKSAATSRTATFSIKSGTFIGGISGSSSDSSSSASSQTEVLSATFVPLKVKILQSVSSNDLLKSFSVAGYSLNFSPSVTQYALSVSNSVKSLKITALPQESHATVAVGSNAHSLIVGINTVKVTVTAQNGDTKIYSLVVARAKPDESTIDSAALSAYLAQHGSSAAATGDTSSGGTSPKQSASSASPTGSSMPLGQILLIVAASLCACGIVTTAAVMRARRK